MKTILLLALAATTLSLSGCGGVAVVETRRPAYKVHHNHGRAYYYNGNTNSAWVGSSPT